MKIEPHRAFAPPDLRINRDETVVAGIKLWAEKGQFADERQGKIVLNFIIETLCGTHDLSFRPDDAGGQRDTDFHEGRRYVGLNLRRIITRGYTELLTGKKPKMPPSPPASVPVKAG